MKAELDLLRADLVALSKMPPPQAARWLREEKQTQTLLTLVDICLRELDTLQVSDERLAPMAVGQREEGYTQQIHMFRLEWTKREALQLASWIRELPLLPHWLVGYTGQPHCGTGFEGEVIVYHLSNRPKRPVRVVGVPKGGPPDEVF